MSDLVYTNKIVYDHTAASNTEYEYVIYAIKKDGSIRSHTERITPKWNRVSIIGFSGSYLDNEPIKATSDDVWTFSLNIEDIKFTQNLSRNVLSSFGSKYATTIVGDTNYKTFSLSCLLGNVVCNTVDENYGGYGYDTAYIAELWDSFVDSPKAKLVVDTKGNVLVCDIIDSDYGYQGSFIEQPTTINAKFIQIAPSDRVSIITEEFI